MHKDLQALLGGADIDAITGTVDENLREIATLAPFPDKALAVCTLRADECAPAIIAVLDKAADGDRLSDAESLLLFRGLHILGGARQDRAFKPLLRFLRRPEEAVEEHLGDGITQSLAKIAAGMFDGDADALFAAISDRRSGEYVRDALLGAATTLTVHGRIDRSATSAFLERFHAERLAGDGDFAWIGWLTAIALLGLEDLAPLVRPAWEAGRLPEDMFDPEDFKALLAISLQAPGDTARLEGENLGYIEDVVVELEWTRGIGESFDNEFWPFEAEDDLDDASLFGDGFGHAAVPGGPAINPNRDIGRNDPCPCGSGRKYKRCCLAR